MKRIFLDYASSTPIAPEVQTAMEPWLNNFANPSALYEEALVAKEAVATARGHIAEILIAQEKEIYFTSGGTESNNIAILGVIRAHKKDGFIPHIVISAIEHSSVLELEKEIVSQECEVTVVPVNLDGLIEPKDIREALKHNTVLVSIMYANNEIGTIQDLHAISRVIQDFKNKNKTTYPYLHTDACQAALYLPLNVLKLGVDLLTLDGIKMYGPRGVGMLYVRSSVYISPTMFGGGQEHGLRSGTENVPGIVGLATALEMAEEKKNSECARLTTLRNIMIEKILALFPQARLNGSLENRLPNNINICFPGMDAEFTVISLDIAGISASYSSSCLTLSQNSSSYVVAALGKPECANSSLRFTMGRETTEGDMEKMVKTLVEVVK